MKHIDSDGSPTKGESEQAARKLAAKILGRLGGKASRGAAKSRSSEHCRAAVNKRWEAYGARKAAQGSPEAAEAVSEPYRKQPWISPRNDAGMVH